MTIPAPCRLLLACILSGILALAASAEVATARLPESLLRAVVREAEGSGDQRLTLEEIQALRVGAWRIRLSQKDPMPTYLVSAAGKVFCRLRDDLCMAWIFRVGGDGRPELLLRGYGLAIQKARSKGYQDLADYRRNDNPMGWQLGPWIRREFEWDGNKYRPEDENSISDEDLREQTENTKRFVSSPPLEPDFETFLASNPEYMPTPTPTPEPQAVAVQAPAPPPGRQVPVVRPVPTKKPRIRSASVRSDWFSGVGPYAFGATPEQGLKVKVALPERSGVYEPVDGGKAILGIGGDAPVQLFLLRDQLAGAATCAWQREPAQMVGDVSRHLGTASKDERGHPTWFSERGSAKETRVTVMPGISGACLWLYHTALFSEFSSLQDSHAPSYDARAVGRHTQEAPRARLSTPSVGGYTATFSCSMLGQALPVALCLDGTQIKIRTSRGVTIHTQVSLAMASRVTEVTLKEDVGAYYQIVGQNSLENGELKVEIRDATGYLVWEDKATGFGLIQASN